MEKRAYNEGEQRKWWGMAVDWVSKQRPRNETPVHPSKYE